MPCQARCPCWWPCPPLAHFPACSASKTRVCASQRCTLQLMPSWWCLAARLRAPCAEGRRASEHANKQRGARACEWGACVRPHTQRPCLTMHERLYGAVRVRMCVCVRWCACLCVYRQDARAHVCAQAVQTWHFFLQTRMGTHATGLSLCTSAHLAREAVLSEWRLRQAQVTAAPPE